MPVNDRLTIAVFGKSDAVTTEIVSSWSEIAIDLMGPYSATDGSGHDWNFASAIIDVRYGPELMLPLMDELEAKAIPYIFFVPLNAVGSEQGPFVLSTAREDMRHILTALAAQERGTTH